ncbi:MAG: response regulator transcription factor [Acidobacteria bacterium]|nr:response regulator transcription factor [Acidobacteriota bacterium]
MRYALSLDDLLADTVEKFQINTGSENNPHLNGDILELEEHPRSAGELSIIDRARNTQDLGTGRIYLEEAKDERKPTAPWILLIEDDCVIAGFLSHLLSRRGFEVHLAEDGRKASKMLDEIPPPNLVIMDIMLPFIDGYGLIKLIRSKCEWNDVPILMLTSKTHEQEINRALEEGATDYMMKPFQSCELIARVDQYLA